jgi:hypothetical protein
MLTPITVTHGEVILARAGLRGASSKNGLVAVKLHRLRAQLEREFAPITAAWKEIDGRNAKQNGAGEPVVRTDAAGNPVMWTLTETPAYEVDPQNAETHARELTEFQNGSVTFHVERFTVDDLSWIEAASEHAGLALSLFSPPDEHTNGAGPG